MTPLFLDTSVLLSACGSGKGAARYIVMHGRSHGWTLHTSPYCVEETCRNLSKLPMGAPRVWQTKVHPHLALVSDEIVLDRPLLFPKSKDRPVVVSALAADCDALLTLDETDFHGRLGLCFNHHLGRGGIDAVDRPLVPGDDRPGLGPARSVRVIASTSSILSTRAICSRPWLSWM